MTIAFPGRVVALLPVAVLAGLVSSCAEHASGDTLRLTSNEPTVSVGTPVTGAIASPKGKVRVTLTHNVPLSESMWSTSQPSACAVVKHRGAYSCDTAGLEPGRYSVSVYDDGRDAEPAHVVVTLVAAD